MIIEIDPKEKELMKKQYQELKNSQKDFIKCIPAEVIIYSKINNNTTYLLTYLLIFLNKKISKKVNYMKSQ